jgi:hypothetical protein
VTVFRGNFISGTSLDNRIIDIRVQTLAVELATLLVGICLEQRILAIEFAEVVLMMLNQRGT